MALTKAQWCDIMIHTLKRQTVERIPFEPEFWDAAQTKLTKFFTSATHILPHSDNSTVNGT